jgi:hypothetical protein
MFHYGVHYYFLFILFFLIVGHALGDFPLQGQYLSEAKNPTSTLGANGVWRWALFFHSMIHGGIVAFFTHSLILGLLEAISHAIIDYSKCHKRLTFNQDQCLHVLLKVIWAWCAATRFI